MPFAKEFQVCNPSPYERSDYVEVDLRQLEVPDSLNESRLRLCRLRVGQNAVEVPFQIDRIFGSDHPDRMLTFLSEHTAPGPEDYSKGTATFSLQERITDGGPRWETHEDLAIDHYYVEPVAGEPPDGFNPTWDPSRRVQGIKLHGGVLEVHFSLMPSSTGSAAANLAGAATSVELNQTPMLSPHLFDESTQAWWGQLAAIGWFPLPWEGDRIRRVSLLSDDAGGKEYTLTASRCGPIRATVTIKSEPIEIRYKGEPFFQPDELSITCNVHRVISVYPGEPYYREDVHLRTDDGKAISFRAYFSSQLDYDSVSTTRVARFEHIPDYFAVWKHWGAHEFGHGFAADSHARDVTCQNNGITWRVQLAPWHSCIHYFMLHCRPCDGDLDPFSTIGHNGWYEKTYKRLEVVPLTRYASWS